jgi:hypothetical protein
MIGAERSPSAADCFGVFKFLQALGALNTSHRNDFALPDRVGLMSLALFRSPPRSDLIFCRDTGRDTESENAHHPSGQSMTCREGRRFVDEHVFIYPAITGFFKGLLNRAGQQRWERAVSGLRLKEHPCFSAIKADSQKGSIRETFDPCQSRSPTVANHRNISSAHFGTSWNASADG